MASLPYPPRSPFTSGSYRSTNDPNQIFRADGSMNVGNQQGTAGQPQAPSPGYGPQSGSPYAGFNPQDIFGYPNSSTYPAGPFNRRNQFEQYGAGLYGLPDAFQGWSGPARYALAPTMNYAQQAQPAINQFRQAMGTDWASTLYGQSADVINAQGQAAQRTGQQRLAQAGYGGGGTISPFAGLQVQQENLARSGQLGNAARMAVMQGQQMQAEAGRNYLNSIAQNMQAMLTPAQLEVSRQAKVPTTGGPSLIGPAINAAAAGLGAYAGA